MEEVLSGVTFLLVLSCAMFFGSYFAGQIPLLFTMSESRLRLVTIFGAGLLVGTALSVIVPEGVEALYSAQIEQLHSSPHRHSAPLDEHPHEAVAAQSILGHDAPPGEPARIIPKDANLNQGLAPPNAVEAKLAKRDADAAVADQGKNHQGVGTARRKRSTDDSHDSETGHASDHSHGEATEHHGHSHGNVHAQIGYSLVCGFIFMLLVDQIGSSTINRGERSGRIRMSISATVGLVVHAAADGIALGSASTINKSDVQLIVFIAIMLHKGPSAFGLVSFLLMEGLDKNRVRKHLLIFSCSAPIAAMTTFLVLANYSPSSASSSTSTTGVLMLFSAGTFLYVATVHVLPELNQHGTGTRDYTLVDMQAPSTAGHSHSHGGPNFSMKELGTIIVGSMIPAVLASGHSH